MDIVYIVPVLLFSIVVHEVAHAWQALQEGDPTARDMGRITLNPLPHLDLVGSLIVPFVLYLLPGDLIFGWAKPVRVDPEKYRNTRAGDIRVSLAGIVANLVLVAFCAAALVLLYRLAGNWAMTSATGSALSAVLAFGALINLVLAFFNLIPIPPLDGSHVLRHFLPRRLGDLYAAVGKYGIAVLVLVALFYRDAFQIVFAPVLATFSWIMGLAIG